MSAEQFSSNTLRSPRTLHSTLGVFATPLQILIIIIPVLMVALSVSTSTSELAEVVFGAISDAYLQVSTFVAATLLVFYGIEKIWKIDAGEALRNARLWQVPLAAGFGALPGCGGAIIVMTQYVSGRLSFGSVVAVLTATMGDAAFLLISQMPLTGLAMVVLGFVVGSLSGWAVDLIHGSNFLYDGKLRESLPGTEKEDTTSPIIKWIWFLILIPGLVLAGLLAFQVDIDAVFGNEFNQRPATTLGVVGGMLAVMMQLAPRLGLGKAGKLSKNSPMLSRVVRETNFVTLWVITAYLAFELPVYFFAFDFQALFKGWAVLTPLISVVIGFLPGCGPQILITTMYIAGYIPLSAQIGNAISNDGDALFPAIAIAPKVAIIATLYSAVPALIVSYIFFLSFEY